VIDFTYLLEPLAEDSPCGPDLDIDGDPQYFNYLIPAEGRLPNSYFDMAGRNMTGELVFDRAGIDLESEIKQVSALLDKSRDLRLLALLAQFHSATSSIDGFAACLSAIRSLLETRWEDVRPAAANGDFSLRMVSVEAIDDRVRVAIPLSFFPLMRDKKVGIITYRSLEIALRPETKRANETPLPLSAIQEAFRSEDGRAALVQTLAMVRHCADCLISIRSLFRERTDFSYVPSFDNTLGVLEDIYKTVSEEVPGLLGTVEPVNAGNEFAQHGESLAGHESNGGQYVPRQEVFAAGPLLAIGGHAEARDLLAEIEKYFLGFEPSSPALMLVHQARALVGKPLVEALEAIAPSRLDGARILFDSASGLSIGFDRMRQLSASIHSGDIALNGNGAAVPLAPIASRQEAMTAMVSVESFLSSVEPSSPSPLLLAKARSLMSKNFAELLKELLAAGEAHAI
jgi:type VI secretion system protein ImpA